MKKESPFISKEGFADDLCVSGEVIKGWIRRHWDRGYHFKVIGKTTFIHKRRANKWISRYGQQV